MEIRAHKAELHRHHQREILETRAHKEYDRQKFRQGYTGARLKCKCTSNSIGVRTYVLCVCERMSESINTIYVLLVRKDLQWESRLKFLYSEVVSFGLFSTSDKDAKWLILLVNWDTVIPLLLLGQSASHIDLGTAYKVCRYVINFRRTLIGRLMTLTEEVHEKAYGCSPVRRCM